jgi:hypothetical protein
MATDDAPRPGNGEAYELYDKAWYHAIDSLMHIVRTGDDTQAIAAAHEILEYSKHFTILGAPYVPYSEKPIDLEDD